MQCSCGVMASRNVVKKQGPNQGRVFFSCASRSCKFFKWGSSGSEDAAVVASTQKDSSSSSQEFNSNSNNNINNNNNIHTRQKFQPPPRNTSAESSSQQHVDKIRNSNTTSGSFGLTIPKCKHGLDAILLKVKKEGPNQNKLFWSCTEQNDSCKFFEWFKGNHSDYEHLINVNPNKKKNSSSSLDETDPKKSKKKIEMEICTLEMNDNNELSMRQFDTDNTIDEEILSKHMKNSIALRLIVPITDCLTLKTILSQYKCLNDKEEKEEDEESNARVANLFYEYSNYNSILKTLKNSNEISSKYNVIEIPSFVQNLIEKYQNLAKQNSSMDVWNRIPQKLQDSLLPFQKTGVEFGIKRQGRIMIADEMGLGKTIQCIAIACHFSNDWPLWIVCPGSLKANWKKEILKWIGGNTLYINGSNELITSSQINVIDTSNQIDDGTSLINIISYDLLAKDNVISVVENEFKENKTGMIICDESHLLKSLSSKRSQNLVPLIERAKRVILASGTSCMSRPIELYSQIKAILPDHKITKLDFGYRYCGLHQQPRNDSDYKGSSRLSELFCLLVNTIMIRRLKRDVLGDLPPKKRSKYYLQVKEEYLKKLNSIGESSGQQKKHSYFGGDWQKLQRDRDIVAKYMKTAEAKIDGIKQYLRKLIPRREKFLIFAHHRCVMDAIEETVKSELAKLTKTFSSRVSDDILDADPFKASNSSQTKKSSFDDDIDVDLQDEGISFDYIRIDGDTKDREALTHHFRSTDNCLVAILSMNVAGCGLNFVPCSHVVFAELSWNPALLNQCEDRCHRIGQRGAFVDITYLLAKKTLDDFMWNLLTKKADITDLALNGQKEEKSNHLTRSVEDITTPKKKPLSFGSGSIEKYLNKPSPATCTSSESTTSTSPSSTPPHPSNSHDTDDDVVEIDLNHTVPIAQQSKSKVPSSKRPPSTSPSNNNNSPKSKTQPSSKKKKHSFPQQKNTLFSYYGVSSKCDDSE
ncbi:hypothetical protein FDP41_013487 [Naegleria fowleri]|uniref:Uncharacterized protein n=1 Tax=Naegleria fowleri TaxID=5763 RepID=A0A6A5BQF6_NAEFO|nr:uncharacterized protein FDP41_013487 [Naegleria fowleri]KAF0980273.1 hypothetical protein FDP41_013487 [Naegleria fowleri]